MNTGSAGCCLLFILVFFPLGSSLGIREQPMVTFLLQHGHLCCCYTESPSSCRNKDGLWPICLQNLWGLPVYQAWALFRLCSTSGAHIRDVEIRHNLVDHTEHVKNPMGLSSVPGVNHPAESNFFSKSSESGHGEAESTGQTLTHSLNTTFCMSKGLQGCMGRKQHMFKQLHCVTKGRLMTLSAHTFPVLEEMQISWLGSFPEDVGLPPSRGCQTHESSLLIVLFGSADA